MSQETEIKLELHPDDLPRLLAHPLLKGHRAASARLRNTYFDTSALSLRAQRMAVRERRVGRRTLLTVKTAGTSVGGLSRRSEWEAPRPPGPLDFTRLVDDAVLAEQLNRVAWQLVPVFRTDFVRRSWQVAHGGARIEIALDDGFITTGDAQGNHRQRILELELELLDGPVDALLDLAHTLVLGPSGQTADALRLRPAQRSKAERGYALFAGDVPQPVKAAPLALRRDMHPVSAFQAAALACLVHLQANEGPAIWPGAPAPLPDPEFIHQARVALRRLRTGLRLFRGHLGAGWVAHWSAEWKSVADALGAARNWDVLATEWLPDLLPALSADAAAQALQDWVDAQRRQALRHAGAVLASPAHALRTLAFARAVIHLAPPARRQTPDLAGWARGTLRQGHARLRQQARRARHLGPEGRHELRLALKKLRYTQEFLASVLPPRRAARSTASLSDAQALLGTLNDLTTAQDLLAQAPADLSPDVTGLLRAALQQRLEAGLQALPGMERDLERAPLPW